MDPLGGRQSLVSSAGRSRSGILAWSLPQGKHANGRLGVWSAKGGHVLNISSQRRVGNVGIMSHRKETYFWEEEVCPNEGNTWRVSS